jgi:hypothetical protein
MGKLFEFIKSRYEVIRNFNQLKKEDFVKSRAYDTFRNAYIQYELVGKVLSNINSKCSVFLGDKFKNFINNNQDLALDGNGIIIPEINGDLDDIEETLNKLEDELDENQINSIIESSQEVIENNTLKPLHIFEGPINKVKRDLALLNPTDIELSEAEKNEIITSLDYANSVIVENRNGNINDDIIDELSELDKQERINLPEYADKVGISLDDINKVDYGTNKISITFNSPEYYDKFAPVMKQKIHLTEEYKNKIKALDNYISQKSIIKNPVFGETGYKEYSFIDWFSKADELKREIITNYRLPQERREEKIASYKRIITLKKELENITNEYKDVLNYIKANFDGNKISFPGNVYSGRNFKLGDGELEDFHPNLPEMFDNENAGYGVLLNGYGQLKGFINYIGVSLDDFLDDPLKAYYDTCNMHGKQIDAQFSLPRNGNTLGKRIARLLYQPDRKYDSLAGTFMGQRSLEFLINSQDFDEHTFDNRLTSNFTTSLVTMLDHQATNLFLVNPDENEEIKKLFAFGNDVDNLLTISKNYRSPETINSRNPDEFNYENRIHDMKDLNPASVCKSVLETLKDYLAERKFLSDHKNVFCNVANHEEYSRRFEPVRMIRAAKEYFEDYIYKNDINISKIRNDEDRELVTDFLCNPAEVLENKYRDVPNLTITERNESLQSYHEDFGTKIRSVHQNDFNNFNTSFAQNNQKPNGFNSNKDMMTILRDNEGSRWEKFFNSTSKEYKTLVSALYAALGVDSATRGDFKFVKYCAKKYLEHKLPEGKNEAKISETGRRRIEFCRTILNSFNELDDRFKEVSVNQPALDIQEPKIANLNLNIAQNNNFQAEIKGELEKDILEDNSKEEIEIKEDLIKENIENKEDVKI